MRYVLTVNRANIDAGVPSQAVRVEDTTTGVIRTAAAVRWDGPSQFIFDPENERHDGARAWVEVDTDVQLLPHL